MNPGLSFPARQRHATTTYTYHYDPVTHRISDVNGVPYGHDARGNVTSIGDFALNWNHANELVSDEFGSTYAYDARGQRVKQTVTAQHSTDGLAHTKYYIYDHNHRLVALIDNGQVTNFIYVGSRPIAKIKGGVTTYVHTDYQNTPLFTSDAAGHVTPAHAYDAYGVPLKSYGTIDSPNYTGATRDASGFLYLGARYLNGARFLSPDPAPLNPLSPTGLNRYAYANDAPSRYTDPDGRNATAFIGGVFVETAHLLTGQGFNGAALVGALVDGYNGKGGGVLHAALQDAGTLSAVAGAAGAVKGVTALVGRVVAKQAIKEGTEIGAEGIGSTFKGKSAVQIDKMFKRKTFKARGPDPVGGKGGYVNHRSGRSYHIDPKGHGKYPNEPNHVDVHRPRGYKGSLPKKKFPYGDE